jgi:hypothetical protein
MGNNIWAVGQVFLPGLRTADAFHDGSGGIVLLLGFYYEKAARFDYFGNAPWSGQPITTISDPENIGVTGGAAGDNRGGAIVPFWSFSGGVKAHHTGRNGIVGIITDVDQHSPNPTSINLNQNYPNPFNPTTNIVYEVQKQEFVELKVFDVLGREVTTLANEMKHPGTYIVTWDASGVASGVYCYRLEAGGNTITTRKMVLLR